MSNVNAASTTVSRNVWLLGQVRGFSTKHELAEAMGWEPSRLSRTLRGERKWTIEDLEDAAIALQLDGPGDLFRPLSDLVGASGPTRSAATGTPTRQYVARERPALTAVPPLGAPATATAATINRLGTANRVAATDVA